MNFKEQREAACKRNATIQEDCDTTPYECDPPVNTMKGQGGNDVDLKPNKNYIISPGSGGNSKTK